MCYKGERVGDDFGWVSYTMSTTTSDYPRRSPRLHPPASKPSRPRDEDDDEREPPSVTTYPPTGQHLLHYPSNGPNKHDPRMPLPLPPVHLIDIIFLVMVVMCVGLVAYCFGQISSDWWGKPLFVSIIGLLAGIALVYDSFILAGVAARRYS